MNHIFHVPDGIIIRGCIVMSELVVILDRIDIHDRITQQIMLFEALKESEMMGLMVLEDVYELTPNTTLKYSEVEKVCTLIILKMKLSPLVF